MSVKIKIDSTGPTSVDGTQYHKAHFVENPTLLDFIIYLANRQKQWGEVVCENLDRDFPYTLFQYNGGTISGVKYKVWPLLEKKIELESITGGWGLVNYRIRIKDETGNIEKG